jgi:hypothetical protein
MFWAYIGVLGIFIGILGGIFFLKSVSKMRNHVRESMNYLVIASLIYITFSSMMIIQLLIGNNDFTNIYWKIIPLLFTFSSIFFIIGTTKLVNLISYVKHILHRE